MKKEDPWEKFKEELGEYEINLFSVFHYLVLIVLWISLAVLAYDEEYSHAVAVAVIIIAWKMKSRVQ